MLLSPGESRRVNTRMKQLEPSESVAKVLQTEKPAVNDVWILFGAVIESFPDTANQQTSSATIVYCLEFETAIVWMKNGNERALPSEESNSASELLSNEVIAEKSAMHEESSFTKGAM